jgi:hypothetical protein
MFSGVGVIEERLPCLEMAERAGERVIGHEADRTVPFQLFSRGAKVALKSPNGTTVDLAMVAYPFSLRRMALLNIAITCRRPQSIANSWT